MIFLYIASAVCAVALILFALEIYLISGRRKHPEMPDFFGRLYAHRGLYSNKAPYDAPENSLAAFSRAVDSGFGVELDLHLSSDGELVVFHDETLSRMCGIDRKVSSFTADELHCQHLLGGDQYIPRFSEVLDIIDGKVPMIVEIKCPPHEKFDDLCRAAVDMLGGYDGAWCVESFNPYVVEWFRRNAPDVFRGQLAEQFYTHGEHSTVRLVLENMWLNVLGRPDFVAYNCKHRNAPAFRLWRRLCRAPAAGWTVRDAETLDTLMREGSYDCLIFEGFVPNSNE